MINLSDVITDPDFCQTLKGISTKIIVTDQGRAFEEKTPFEFTAIIHPSTADELERIPEGDRSSESITIFSLRELRTVSQDARPDLIYYHGNSYLVKSVEMWGDYGFYSTIASRTEVQNA